MARIVVKQPPRWICFPELGGAMSFLDGCVTCWIHNCRGGQHGMIWEVKNWVFWQYYNGVYTYIYILIGLSWFSMVIYSPHHPKKEKYQYHHSHLLLSCPAGSVVQDAQGRYVDQHRTGGGGARGRYAGDPPDSTRFLLPLRRCAQGHWALQGDPCDPGDVPWRWALGKA